MRVREPSVAGSFYPASAEACGVEVRHFVQASPATSTPDGLLYGGLVPHAGWPHSGAVAAEVLVRLASSCAPATIVLFGGVHGRGSRDAAMFGGGRWETPIGPVKIDERLAERVLGHTNLLRDDPYAHEHEHSIEVQMPFIAHLFPGVAVLPIMVPPGPSSYEVGVAVGRTLRAYSYQAIVIGTTDLTHYGPSYNFEPHGTGADALQWAKEENDRRFIDLTCAMEGSSLVAEAAARRNACGAGAIAATIGVATAMGATMGTLLSHTTSAEVLVGRGEAPVADAVGYAGIVFS